MYIIKNALRCVGRSKGRNILISIIALVIAVSACLGLSIRQAAESAKESTLQGLTITATISYDRSAMMNDIFSDGMGQGIGGGFDRDQFANMMGNASALTLEEHQKYATSQSVQDFYYTLTASFNGTDKLLPVSDETEGTENNYNGFGGGMGFPGGQGNIDFSSSDFSVIGYSSDSAMTAFINGTASVLEGGTMFEEGTTENVCVISQELAIYNNLAVGDVIVLTNPSVEGETYELKIVGFYESTANNDFSVSSADLASFESSLTPLNTLSTMAGWFLLVILIIGAVILVVLNIFNVRERKYEVGVLTAMGMKKWKVATQFVCEILVVTMIAVIIGAGVGAVSSVPVTNALLAGQVESQNSQQTQIDNSFGRPSNMPGNMPGGMPSMGGDGNPFENIFGGAVDYITEVNSAMNLTVVLQMLGVGLVLTLVASMGSVMFIMRYDPLKILANRD